METRSDFRNGGYVGKKGSTPKGVFPEGTVEACSQGEGKLGEERGRRAQMINFG